jgi:hypothetical protein
VGGVRRWGFGYHFFLYLSRVNFLTLKNFVAVLH